MKPTFFTWLAQRLRLIILASFVSSPVSAMEFSRVTFQPSILSPQGFVIVYGSGEIDENSPLRARQALARLPRGTIVNLDSNGGSVASAIELAKAFREAGVWTRVARVPADARQVSRNGLCLSACVLAFIGGVDRRVDTGSVVGVHRFFFRGPSTANAVDTTQLVSARIIEHLDSMGVSARLFVEMARAGTEQINTIPKSALASIGITTPLFTTEWETVIADDDIYVKGTTRDENGQHKIIVACEPLPSRVFRPVLLMMYDAPGPAPALYSGDVAFMTDQGSIQVNRSEIAADIERDRGYLSIVLTVSPRIEEMILRSGELGFAFYHLNGLSFEGWRGEILGGRERVTAFLRNCRARNQRAR